MQWGDRVASSTRKGRRLGALVTAVALIATLATMTGPAADARPTAMRVNPLLHGHGFADPSVVKYGGGYIAVSTGIGAVRATAASPTGPWRIRRQAMLRLPGWASNNVIWASDLVRIKHRWLLYYSAPVRGLGAGGRCIGVASSRKALGNFRSFSRRPLVCPGRANTRPAYDRMSRRSHRLPRTGVIDPSGFQTRNGQHYLLYKTQGLPSTIRIVRLTHDGLRVKRRAHSRQLLSSRHIIENPVMLQKRGRFVLMTSEGFYGRCSYKTTWRRSTALGRHWQHARAHVLLRRSSLRVCGPGGADVVTRAGAKPLLFFHGWTCWDTRRACPRRFHIDRPRGSRPQRSLYAAHLRWHRGMPKVRSFLRPR